MLNLLSLKKLNSRLGIFLPAKNLLHCFNIATRVYKASFML